MNFQSTNRIHGKFFYGWYIVAVGILVNIAGTFAFSSTLSIFLKPITEELGVTRGAFSLIRTFEIGVAALIVPMLGPWIDRHGGRGVLVLGVAMESAGLLLSSLVQSFWQFVLVRCSLVIAGEALLGSLVINVTIAQWFVRKRGRAMGIANLGTGIAKFSIPLCAASLFVLIGWRNTWAVFGIVAPLLVIVPALIFVRRRPEDIGLRPDGDVPSPNIDTSVANLAPENSPSVTGAATPDVLASRRHLRHRQRRHRRSQSAHFLLRHRHRLFAADRRLVHEHDRGHSTRLHTGLGYTSRQIRHQESFLCPVFDPGSGTDHCDHQ
jgi:MFS family permease